MAYGNAWSLAVEFRHVSVISRGYTQEDDPSQFESLEKSCFGIMGYSINENTYIHTYVFLSISHVRRVSCEYRILFDVVLVSKCLRTSKE